MKHNLSNAVAALVVPVCGLWLGLSHATAQPETHEHDEAPSTVPSGIQAEAVSACPVPGLTPITDEVAKQFEATNGNAIWTKAPFAQDLLARMKNFENRVVTAGGQFRLNSAYRPSAYQLHLQEVYDRWVQLQPNTNPACETRKANVRAEFVKHGLGLGRRPGGASGPHTKGLAFDASVTGLEGTRIDRLAGLAGLWRPLPRENKNHVDINGKPIIDEPHYESREDKVGRGWCPSGVISTAEFTPKKVSLAVGEVTSPKPVAKDGLGATVTFPNANYVWWSTNPAVATVGKLGAIKGIASGTTTITAMEFTSGKVAALTVQVGMTISPQEPKVLSLGGGGKETWPRIQFTVKGGTPPYTWSMPFASFAGTINSETGIFEPNRHMATEVITVTDAMGHSAETKVQVTTGDMSPMFNRYDSTDVKEDFSYTMTGGTLTRSDSENESYPYFRIKMDGTTATVTVKNLSNTSGWGSLSFPTMYGESSIHVSPPGSMGPHGSATVSIPAGGSYTFKLTRVN